MDNQTDDFTMAYQDSCDQATILFIHGFPFNSSMWEPQLEDLSDVVRVIAPDLRGHGQSDPVPGPYSMELLAGDCVRLLDHLSIGGPVVVCGLSMGGYIALEFYRRYPEYVDALILASTRAGADSDEGKANRDKMAAAAREQGADAVVQAMLPNLLSPQTQENDAELVEVVEEMIRSASVEGIVGALMAMKERPDSIPTLAEIDVPTLIIHGADDKIIPVAEAERMHEAIEGSELVIIDDAGHLPNLEQPDAFNDAIVDFLESLEE